MTQFLRQFLRCIPSTTQDPRLDKAGIFLLQLHIEANAVLCPLPEKVTVVQVREQSIAKLGVGFMVTPTPTDPPNPARLAHRLVAYMSAIDEFVQPLILQALSHIAIVMFLRAG